MTRLLKLLGLPSVAALGWYALAFVLAMGAAATLGAGLMHSYDGAQHDKVIAGLRADAATELARETGKVLAAERQGIEIRDQLEKDHADKLAALAADDAAARAGVAAAGGLHDPGTGGKGGDCPVPAAAGAAAGADEGATGRRLSDAAAEFLLDEAARAEAAAIYAGTGHAYALTVQAWREAQVKAAVP